jgi:RNA polymerase sigma-70 factor (ECF subfamily)
MNDVVESRQEMHPSGTMDREQQLLLLEEALKQLGAEQRHCIELFYLGQKSYQQIMTETGLSFKQVKSFIQNGKRNLKIALATTHERKTS